MFMTIAGRHSLSMLIVTLTASAAIHASALEKGPLGPGRERTDCELCTACTARSGADRAGECSVHCNRCYEQSASARARADRSRMQSRKPTLNTNGTKPAKLSSHDCTTLGGTVVGVADDRCGASRQYCRMPNSLAACIDKKD
jgi:hypothetical protein